MYNKNISTQLTKTEASKQDVAFKMRSCESNSNFQKLKMKKQSKARTCILTRKNPTKIEAEFEECVR